MSVGPYVLIKISSLIDSYTCTCTHPVWTCTMEPLYSKHHWYQLDYPDYRGSCPHIRGEFIL